MGIHHPAPEAAATLAEVTGHGESIAAAPVDAEFTGPFFSPNGDTLFLSVQHPGERSSSIESLTSNWPDGGNDIPKPSVICVRGQALQDLMDNNG